jgi:uncharacterized protein (DUF2141 family)
MKTIAKLMVIILSITFTNAQEAKGHDITVTIDNVLNNKGKVIFGLHTADTFMKRSGIQNTESTIEDGKVTITFKNVVPGTYAIIALHDENENNRMDLEDNGMPKESYATSGSTFSYGPPQFSESKFEVSNNDIIMNLRF